MILYIDKSEMEDLEYRMRRYDEGRKGISLKSPFNTSEEFGPDEADQYVKIEIKRVEDETCKDCASFDHVSGKCTKGNSRNWLEEYTSPDEDVCELFEPKKSEGRVEE